MIGATFCSGIGAPELAAPWVDWQLASEIEKFPRAVLEKRFGYKDASKSGKGPRLWGDFTTLKVRHMRRLGIPLPDLVVAGTPCQAFSIAGLRKGTDDARGNLTLQFVRTIHAIVNARPDGKLCVLWENVPGVLSDKGNAFGSFLGGLVGAVDALPSPGNGSWPGEGMVQGPRSRAAWSVLDAQWFGVAQRRRRVFVVVDFGNCVDPAAVLLEPDRLRGDHPPRRETGQGVAGTLDAGLGTRGQLEGERGHLIPQVQGHHGDIAGTVSAKWVKGSGGPAGDETQNMVAFDCRGAEVQFTEDGSHPTLRSMGNNRSNQNTADHAAVAIQERAVSENPNAGPDGAGYRTDDCAYTLEARSQVQSVAFGLSTFATPKYGENVQPALTTPSPSGGGQPPAAAIGPIVRRLMPVECARLQGFPDDHAAIKYRGKPAADGPQYKAYGNSMARPVVEWITDRIKVSWESHQ